MGGGATGTSNTGWCGYEALKFCGQLHELPGSRISATNEEGTEVPTEQAAGGRTGAWLKASCSLSKRWNGR